MANLNTKTLGAGVGDILCVDGGISGDKQIKDGDVTASNLYIDGSNLGIGVATPTHTLQVNGSIKQEDGVWIDREAPAYGVMIASRPNGEAGWSRGYRFVDADDGTTLLGGFVGLGTGDTLTRLTIGVNYDHAPSMHWDVTNNRLGIGTTAPTQSLSVQSTDVVPASFGNEAESPTYIDVVTGDFEDAYSGITFSHNRSASQASANNIGMVRAKQTSTDAHATLKGELQLLYNQGNSLQQGLKISDTGNVGIGTSSPTRKLTVAGSSVFSGIVLYGKTNKTISGGVIDVASGEGPFIAVASQGGAGTADDLDFITIDGGTPPVGTTLFLTRVGGDVITVRTYNHSAIAVDDNRAFYASAVKDFNEAEPPITSLVIGSTYKHIQVIYNGRWSVLDPMITRCNTGE